MIQKRLAIQTVSELADILSVSENELRRLARSVDKFYYFREKPKSSGGFRKISASVGDLKMTQKRINKILSRLDFGENTHYGIKKRSNLTNARVHRGSKITFTLDLKNFFPSVRPERVNKALIDEEGCSAVVASFLTKLVTINYELPQGAPTSTGIVNIITRRMRRRLDGLAKTRGLNFSMLADDIAFSGDTIPTDFPARVKEIIKNEGFKVHPTKGGIANKSYIQKVTGINLAHGASVGERKFKEWRAEHHNKEMEFLKGQISGDDFLAAIKRFNGRKTYAASVRKLVK